MSGVIDFKLTGLQELQAQLVGLGDELGRKALAQAARKAFMPVLDAAKANVPVLSGDLRDAIKLTVKKPKGGDDPLVVVGLYVAKGGNGNGGKELPPSRRWHFIEIGTAHSAPHAYLRPALDSNASRVIELLKAELVQSIARALKKKNKAAAK